MAPSQACVNPLFVSLTNHDDEKKEDDEKRENSATVIPRKRRATATSAIRKQQSQKDVVSSDKTTTSSLSVAKVTMADCLACSGCVTTAETVLIELHSLETLKTLLQTQTTANNNLVFTISPASFGDMLRKLNIRINDLLSYKRRLATFLHLQCPSVSSVIVVDGRVPLEWSLQEAAREFCHAYKQRQEQQESIIALSPPPPPVPTIALSRFKSQAMDGSVVTQTERPESRLPLLASSCPALVCLVEKSSQSAATTVPHLSTTKSPMSMAGAYYTNGSSLTRHVGIMPCHDKKLEASRNDFVSDEDKNKKDVHLVITTLEWWTLLCESVGSDNVDDVKAFLQNLPMSPISTEVLDPQTTTRGGATLVVPSSDTINGDDDDDDDDVEMVDADSMSVTTTNFFAYGSGGYADYIFRFAAHCLFGVLLEGELPWTPFDQTTITASQAAARRRMVSARVASRKRDFYQVILYRHIDGTYSTTFRSNNDVALLRFATAYGLQNIQRVLQYAPFSTLTTATQLPFDYVETMACPSGCPNGGGQIRSSSETRETPTETRERVANTQHVMKVSPTLLHSSSTLDYPKDLCPSGPFGPEAKQLLHTRFHVVPPLQHTMGAAAGVAVQNTQW